MLQLVSALHNTTCVWLLYAHRIDGKRGLFPGQRVGPDSSHNTTATTSLRAHSLSASEPWLRVQPLLKREEWTGSLNNNRDSVESEGNLVHGCSELATCTIDSAHVKRSSSSVKMKTKTWWTNCYQGRLPSQQHSGFLISLLHL